MSDWQPIETAPKDGTAILAWCRSECSDPTCGYNAVHDSKTTKLCLYHAHAEGLSKCEDGLQIIEWGGAWDDSTYEYEGGWMPDWWFRRGSEFEESANPTHWMPLPNPPA